MLTHTLSFNDTPFNRFVLAVNHYVSTGDHIGEGVGRDVSSTHVRLLVPINQELSDDVEDWKRLEARLDEMGDARIQRVDLGFHTPFHMHALDVPKAALSELAQALVTRPGPKGWGTPKALIDEHFDAA